MALLQIVRILVGTGFETIKPDQALTNRWDCILEGANFETAGPDQVLNEFWSVGQFAHQPRLNEVPSPSSWRPRCRTGRTMSQVPHVV
jgi:hypothetical protein